MPDSVLQWEGLTGFDDRPLRFHRVRLSGDDAPPSSDRIARTEVHVWGFILDLSEEEIALARSILSDNERARADRLVSDLHRRWFIAAHAGLWKLLNRYCPRHADLTIERTITGKPYLRDVPSLRFSLTHSYERALVAIAEDRDVGVDLEKVRPEVDVLNLARRFFSKQDQKFVEGQEPAGMHERFLMTWVAREAAAKVDGTGIRFPLHRDHLALAEDGTARWSTQNTGASREPETVRAIRFLSLEAGWVGAVSAEGTDWTVVYRDDTEDGVKQGT
ncbi:MAG: 4'-phosphopantetheinyl transferase superfamily protein [Nitrospira sp.]|nr:4'-phosphopantetheinyl transferase superfamily protein [Nitrospira sp.]MCP9441018.1 4'-phosphopantetheinyl transferase superfamily protein [Nitrospira sp.]